MIKIVEKYKELKHADEDSLKNYAISLIGDEAKVNFYDKQKTK
jgi:hypothetical protein